MGLGTIGLGAAVLLLIIFIGVTLLIMNQGVPQSSEDYKKIALSSNKQDSTLIEPRIINVKAEKFKYEPSVIKVKKGERVKIVVNNADTTHGIIVPELSISGIDSVEFNTDKIGTYEFKCPTMCGSGHREMKGTLIVEE